MHYTQKEIDINNVSIIVAGIIASTTQSLVFDKVSIKGAYNIYTEIKNHYPLWYANQPASKENIFNDGVED